MGMTSVFYVPDAQDKWSGREEEITAKLWKLGIFVEDIDVLAEYQRQVTRAVE